MVRCQSAKFKEDLDKVSLLFTPAANGETDFSQCNEDWQHHIEGLQADFAKIIDRLEAVSLHLLCVLPHVPYIFFLADPRKYRGRTAISSC